MKERRYAVLWVHRDEVIDLMLGAIRLVNLPADARIEAMDMDFSMDAIALRIWSASFDLTHPGMILPKFDGIFEPATLPDVILTRPK